MNRKLHPMAATSAVIWISLSGGCMTVKPVVVDRKTALENQILGTFQRLEDDVILASSVRGDEPPTRLTPLQREAVEAMMTREFIRDDIEAWKTQQAVGEAKSGLLEVLALPNEADQARQVQQLVEEENTSRKVILQRVISLSGELSEKDLPMVQLIFYRLNVQTSRPGDKVQLQNGNWQVIQRASGTGASPSSATVSQRPGSK
jgi:uncharacterized protein YdbL (DUF1318 family)